MSCWVISTWATGRPWGSSRSAHRSISRRCPTAAAAWRVGMSVGRRSRPRADIPAAMAPDETTTISTPRSRRSTIWSVIRLRRATSGLPSDEVRLEVPSLTTMRLAPAGRWLTGAESRPATGPLTPGLMAPGSVAPGPSIGGGPPFERRRPDVDLVARVGPRAGEQPLHARAVEALLQEGDGLGIAEVAHRHPAFHRAAGDPPRPVVVPAHRQPPPLGAEQFEATRAGGRLARCGDDLHQPAHKGVEPGALGGRDHQGGKSRLPEHPDGLLDQRRLHGVHLVEDHHLGALRQFREVGRDLVAHRPVGREEVLIGTEVDEVDEGEGALGMAEEPQPKPLPLVGALDEPGDVADSERAVAERVAGRGILDAAQRGFQRGEGVGGHLGTRRRERPYQRRLAGVREADDRDLGDEAQYQADPAGLARRTQLTEARRTAGVRQERRVAAAPAAT